MSERRDASSVRLWALLFVVGLIVAWIVLLRLFVLEEEPGGGPATAEPSAARYGQALDLKA